MEIRRQERCGVSFYACSDPAWTGAAHGSGRAVHCVGQGHRTDHVPVHLMVFHQGVYIRSDGGAEAGKVLPDIFRIVPPVGARAAQAMIQDYGCQAKNILAAIGPGIGPCCFELGGGTSS